MVIILAIMLPTTQLKVSECHFNKDYGITGEKRLPGNKR